MLSSRKKIKERDWMLVELVRDFLKVFDDSKKKKNVVYIIQHLVEL